jgi:opacity protein-like surface antigen
LLTVTLIVLVVAQNPDSDTCEPGLCGGTAMASSFQRAVQRVLGTDARVQTQLVTRDPSDTESAAMSQGVDGVVELSFTPEGQKARLHCYVSRERRWFDREITFGESRGSAQSEVSERGRLLGFAVATMYASEAEREPAPTLQPAKAESAPSPVQAPRAPSQDRPPRPSRGDSGRRTVEFGAIVSSGIRGMASGLGASVGFRAGLAGPVWGRLFVAGRSGNIPEAQASTRTALLGGGLALALLPKSSSFELGARVDGFASYFDASHLSEDDVEPDLRSRWQAGGDVVAEGGFRITQGAGVFVGAGLEAVLGKTDIYTHNNLVAVVPSLRATAELQFRTQF